MAKAKTAEPTAPPVSLFDIGTEFLEMHAALMESGGEWTDEIEARFGSLEALDLSQEKKVDSYIALLKRSEFDQQPADAQKQWHQAQAKTLDKVVKAEENFRDRLKARLCQHMERLDLLKLAGSVWSVARHKNSAPRKVTMVADIPVAYCRYVEPVAGYWVPDEDKVREALLARERYVAACEEQGVAPEPGELDGKATIGPQAYHVKIV